ncbi:MAG: GHKL domain-containing protein [Cyanobacteria bacterium SIG27]|nr:GHKL domain-containing protein [Cyanobacteria bacterium SIG27]
MAKLKEKKDEYVAKIVHDLKTPIYAQISALQSFLTTASEKISQEEQDLIKLTLNSCNYLNKLVEIFNSVNKLNFETIKLNYEKFDIVELINSLIYELNILIKYYELNITFDCSRKIIINADKLQIKRVIENLLSNSINYAFKKSTVEINLTTQKNQFIFEITNKSPYIEPEILKEIFKKYKTHSSLYNKNGVGLGLYLSKEIINAHLGSMIAKSYENNTNIFGFRIPID